MEKVLQYKTVFLANILTDIMSFFSRTYHNVQNLIKQRIDFRKSQKYDQLQTKINYMIDYRTHLGQKPVTEGTS